MNWKTLLTGSGLALAACIGFASCEKASQAASGGTEPASAELASTPAGEAEPAASDLAPDTSELMARVNARWDVITHDDWIQAYDYLTPDLKDLQKLSQFLSGKEDHQYRNPGKPRLVGVDGALAFVDIEVVWTPLHAQIYQAQNVPPEGLTQVLRTIETWVWVDGEWYWQATDRREDFYKAHEDLRPE